MFANFHAPLRKCSLVAFFEFIVCATTVFSFLSFPSPVIATTYVFGEIGAFVEPNSVPATDLPVSFELNSTYPNPFNHQASINFALPKSGKVDIGLFDLVGRRVFTVSERVYEAGSHNVALDASGLSNGLYFVRITNGSARATARVVLVK